MGASYLFRGTELETFLSAQRLKMQEAIERIDADILLSSPIEDLVDQLARAYGAEVPKIDLASASMDQEETKIDITRVRNVYVSDLTQARYVAGTRLILSIPFSGNASLFFLRTNPRMGVQPLAEVEDQYVHVHMEYVSQDEGQVAAILAEGIRTLEWHLSVMAKAAEPWNLTLPNDARARIQARKDRLLRDRGLAETLGFPIRKRQTSLPTYSLDVRKKIGVPDLERSSTAPFAPQLCLSMSAYEEILSVIQRMSEVMERSPSSFAGIDEEGLRSHFLASLNGSFETDSTGETFNAGGKTDIFLRSNGGNAFVAECKMWKGQGAVPGIIDQLLGYVTWRDTKTAVLLFNRNKGFSEVLGKARLAAEKHPMFKRSLPYEIANGYRGVYSHPDDPNREVTITTLIFDVPIKDF